MIVSGVSTAISRPSTSAKPWYSAFSGPKNTRCMVWSMYPAVRITPKQAMIASVMIGQYAAPLVAYIRIELFSSRTLPFTS